MRMKPSEAGGRPPRVVVVGSCIADYCMQVARLPRAGETVTAHALTACLGGKGSNQAIGLARLGSAVTFLGSVGSDVFGGMFRSLFLDENVDARWLVAEPGVPTGVGVPLVLADGRNAIVVAPAAALHLRIADVERAKQGIEHADALLLQLEVPREAAQCAMNIARGAGTPVFLNPAPVVPASADLVNLANVIIANEKEAEWLSGLRIANAKDALVAADVIRDQGPDVAIVTLGRKGATVSAGDHRAFIPGFRVRAVDTTGAGDAFCAGFVHSRMSGLALNAGVEFANACGALACRHAGALPSLPWEEEVRKFLSFPPGRWRPRGRGNGG